MKLDAYTLVSKGSFLHRVEISRTNSIDDFSLEELAAIEASMLEPPTVEPKVSSISFS